MLNRVGKFMPLGGINRFLPWFKPTGINQVLPLTDINPVNADILPTLMLKLLKHMLPNASLCAKPLSFRKVPLWNWTPLVQHSFHGMHHHGPGEDWMVQEIIAVKFDCNDW